MLPAGVGNLISTGAKQLWSELPKSELVNALKPGISLPVLILLEDA